jgi:hypothetical protein
MLYTATFLLVVYLMLTHTFQSWLFDYFAIEHMKSALTLKQASVMAVGVTSSGMIISFYLPTALILKNRIRLMAIEAVGESTPARVSEWISAHGFVHDFICRWSTGPYERAGRVDEVTPGTLRCDIGHPG